MSSSDSSSGQRRRSLQLLVFAGIRTVAWTVLIVCVVLGLLHFSPFHWAANLAKAISFVTIISLYANWATDLGGFQAAYAALVASSAHEDAEDVSDQLSQLEADIEALAKSRGVAARELATSINDRVQKLAK
jgi:hypothetical protein